MDSTSQSPSGPEARRMQILQEELTERIERALGSQDSVTPIDGLLLYRVKSPTKCTHSVSEPSLCVIAQGSKEIQLGEERYRYDPANYLLSTVELPVSSQILEASEEQPFLSVVLRLDPTLVSSVMVEAAHPAANKEASARGLDVSELDTDLTDSILRLVRLIDSPGDAHFLAPLIIKEIVYRLLIGEQGDRLRHLAVLGGHSHRIAKAIARIRSDFDQHLQIEDIAKDLAMSTSSFHHHFKEVTAMTPLQYQKQMRLQEARRLMLGEELDAATAGYQVGYNDPSHFSREYKRLFGQPPMSDIEQIRQETRENADGDSAVAGG